MEINKYDFIIIGGGAAGFFTAINIAEINPEKHILILEKSGKFLDKVRISGGGRCNVTHACWEPKELVRYYPRGSKELLGPFHRFMSGDMLSWLDDHGVETKIESDGRIFPASNTSQTILDCFLGQAQNLGVKMKLSEGMKDFTQNVDHTFTVSTTKDQNYLCDKLVIATGGSKSIWKLLQAKNVRINPPVPSLFTFNIDNPIIKDLPGVSVEYAEVEINGFKMKTTGPIMITHWGLSGPGILKLSAWAARWLNQKDYEFTIRVAWKQIKIAEAMRLILRQKKKHGANKTVTDNIFYLPKRLWKNITLHLKINTKNWADLSKVEIQKLIDTVRSCAFKVSGKSTNKDEFVTSGGIVLNQVNFKTMESKNIRNLFFAGEILDIDALTGGFNFQSAWTTGWIISQNCY